MNGLPISNVIEGCCINDPCYCRSDVVFYNGKAYDQKPYLAARLRTRPGNVMYMEGKLVPPFVPGKSPQIYGPYRNNDRYPRTMGYNESQFGKPMDRCCTTSIYNDTVPPYHNTRNFAYSRLGLPFGETLGYFRFKPDKICDCRTTPVQKLGDCCTCEPGEYNPAQYRRDECPGQPCCC
ncbi:unnamed protein product [Candidula unifasciata]|uniref:Uncharacterized protein n=1 Tax=Candidula unifasciata TaxID=100452 RepID=A0A8S4A1X6_9EUPU|nr:unnamed protein product [Candidula unifasciata]